MLVENGVVSRHIQPRMVSNPFAIASSFPHLHTLTLIRPSWTIAAYETSPILELPSCLQHLTIWAYKTTKLENLIVPYADLFPQLETLRLCLSSPGLVDRNAPLPHTSGLSQKFKATLIPPMIKTLSLVIPFILPLDEAFHICQPIGFLVRDFMGQLANKVNPMAVTFPSPYTAELPADDLKRLTPYKYRFEALQFFEWGGFWLNNQKGMPPTSLMSPNLRHYTLYCDLVMLRPLPRDSSGEEDHSASQMFGPPTGLLTAVMDDDYWFDNLPTSITHLSSTTSTNPECWKPQWNWSNRFPYLRILETNAILDTNALQLPDTITRLKMVMPHRQPSPLFAMFPAPAALTHLTLTSGARQKCFKGIPSTLKVLEMVTYADGRDFRGGIAPHLPGGLQTLRISLQDFAADHLDLIPRGLKYLEIEAQSMLLPEWKRGQIMSNEPVAFDVSGLPPNLEHFILTVPTSDTALKLRYPLLKLVFPAAMFSKLPRTLKTLAISNVLLGSSESNPPVVARRLDAEPVSGISSFFDSIAKVFSATPPNATVDAEIIKEALNLLPRECWCKLHFMADIDGSIAQIIKRQPRDLMQLVQDCIASPLIIEDSLSESSRTTLNIHSTSVFSAILNRLGL